METLNNSPHERLGAKVSIGFSIPGPHRAVPGDWIDPQKRILQSFQTLQGMTLDQKSSQFFKLVGEESSRINSRPSL